VAARRRGPIELAISRLIRDLASDEVAGREVYAQMATRLARTLDEGAGLAVAAVNRELRETVKALTAKEGRDDGDPRTDEFLARLRAPLGHTKN
jgi:hypothetical protein